MHRTTRRQFLGQMAAASATGFVLGAAPEQPPKKRRMTIDLCCGRIGVRANQQEAIELAHRHGFESVEPNAGQLGRLSDRELADLLAGMKAKGLTFGAAGLPVDFRRDEEQFLEGMQKLPALAAALKRVGVTRIGTWLRPSHKTLTYLQNFKQHARRLRAVAGVLGEHGLRFGLEYVGPKTSWTTARFPFIHTMVETKELIAEIGCDNVGFVLDSWHWYTAGESGDDLLSLKNNDVVAVDLNDAPAGLAVDEQQDGRRELPCATGVIDLATFLNVLSQMDYNGPVRAEPFNAALRKLPQEQALAATATAMKKAFALIK